MSEVELENLVKEKVNDFDLFYLKPAPKFDAALLREQTLKFVFDGFQSRNSQTLVLACILNSILAQRRILFCINKKRALDLVLKNRNLSRRKRERLALEIKEHKLNYRTILNILYKTELFDIARMENGYGHRALVLKIVHPAIYQYLDKVTSEASQVEQMSKYFSNAKKRAERQTQRNESGQKRPNEIQNRTEEEEL